MLLMICWCLNYVAEIKLHGWDYFCSFWNADEFKICIVRKILCWRLYNAPLTVGQQCRYSLIPSLPLFPFFFFFSTSQDRGHLTKFFRNSPKFSCFFVNFPSVPVFPFSLYLHYPPVWNLYPLLAFLVFFFITLFSTCSLYTYCRFLNALFSSPSYLLPSEISLHSLNILIFHSLHLSNFLLYFRSLVSIFGIKSWPCFSS